MRVKCEILANPVYTAHRIATSRSWRAFDEVGRIGTPEVSFEEIAIDLLQARFWIASGLPTIRALMTRSAFPSINPTDEEITSELPVTQGQSPGCEDATCLVSYSL